MKEFKSIDEQILLLKNRGMTVGDNAYIILLRENYYSVINGYKDPFLDKKAMQSHADDMYCPGVSFDDIYALFEFDRELRHTTFSYLIQAEAALKTATVYAFCQVHQNPSDYLERSSFADAHEMLVAKNFKGDKEQLYRKNLNKLMKILNEKLIIKASSRPFVVHYLHTYGEVPLWVLVNDLTFGNMAHFYQLMRRSEQNAVCKHLYKTTLRKEKDKKLSPHEVLRAYEVLVYFRNLCAHDERLYCAKKNTDTYKDMLRLLEVALPKSTVNHLEDDLRNLFKEYENQFQLDKNTNLRKMLGLAK